MSRAHPLALAIAALLLAAIMAPRRLNAAEGVVLNGDLAKGSAEQPDNWRTEAWVNDPNAFAYGWTHPENGGPGQLEVNALKANDARWMQSLTLKPGWYHFTAQVRTEKVGEKETGATISIMEDGISSTDIKGTSDWQTVGLYMKVGGTGADVDLALRVGGFGSLNTGKAFFRDVRAEKLEAPPPSATPVFDLMAIRKAAEPVPIGHPITLVATFAVLAAVTAWGWRMFAIEEPLKVRTEPVPTKPAKAATKSKSRR